ncbi:hypothetical protein I7I50_04779 [Histoplasma capsulatum G186AR]|uniref:Uncharacterized protein n=1 Tax=Ajellomyces capsulatus TaxID=5037 RepID=A0A8H8CXY5_AJECA|nr:hypothetical protein I7I52_05688 [Histoplasma capsulatum]QSS75594.1 hypothetical protein I7I50_04779 [Histoplasma capsulatum G186AR]
MMRLSEGPMADRGNEGLLAYTLLPSQYGVGNTGESINPKLTSDALAHLTSRRQESFAGRHIKREKGVHDVISDNDWLLAKEEAVCQEVAID